MQHVPLEVRRHIIAHVNTLRRRDAFDRSRARLAKLWPAVMRRRTELPHGMRVKLPLRGDMSLQIYRYRTRDFECKRKGRYTLWTLSGVRCTVRTRGKLLPFYREDVSAPGHLKAVLYHEFDRVLRECNR